jgi:hypothetical protein
VDGGECPYADATDHDGDGWAFTDGDCDDCAQRVNPGAYEFAGNGVDDDCDGSTVDDVATAACSTAAQFSAVVPLDAARAMDICQIAEADPPLAERKWGLIGAEYRLANGDVPSPSAQDNMANWQAAVLADYGTGGIVPLAGTTMLGLSTGRMRDRGDPGFVATTPGTTFESSSTPPSVFLGAHGGSLPGSSGCSGNCTGGDGANDSVSLRLQIRVPTNAASFAFRYRYFSVSYWGVGVHDL